MMFGLALGDDVFIEVICYLDAVSIVRLLRTSKQLWKLHQKQLVIDRIFPYKNDIAKALWNSGLKIATSKNNIPQIQYFIEKGADCMSEALNEAALHGNISLVHFFVDKGACRWNKAFVQAAKGGHKRLVKYFEQKGALTYNAAISVAVEGGHEDVIAYLKDKMKMTLEDLERICKHQEMVNIIRKGNIHEITEAMQRIREASLFSLQEACLIGRKDIVETLGQRRNVRWSNLLNLACKSGNRELVEFIISKGGILTEQYNLGMQTAIEKGHKDLVNLMIECGADWELGLCAAARAGDKELVEMFLKKGAKDLNNAVIACASSKSPEMIEYLLQIGKRVKFQWKSIVEDAVYSGNEDLVKFLVMKADRRTCWNTALQLAIYTDHPRMIELFIRRGANDWNAALKEAVKAADLNLVKYFVKKGAVVEEASSYFQASQQQDILDYYFVTRHAT